MHRQNKAKRMIRHFKNHFLSILAGIDESFLPNLWDLLLPQAKLTLTFSGNWPSTLAFPCGNTSTVRLTSIRPHSHRRAVRFSFTPNLPRDACRTFAQNWVSTWDRLWNTTGAMTWSTLKRNAREFWIYLNSDTPTSIFLRYPQ